ncbi:neuronal membrane glycoprotein M6-a-like isoform X2 [Gigantopelta aegis]|uniref:neuronal membrane glycoprotein M6-a-like isoform X2 n=1 Tax=Gigantopelta aegis TaxID=1735272 RepID=UPI001B88850B|nr:neuronal membrane glycoprotein M6-a-like isoform X2 [Gigantopelta aegis]
MDEGYENQNEVNINAPIVVDETESVNFDQKLEDHTAEKPRTPNEEDEEARNATCCEKIIKCLSHVPFASLVAWIILVIGLGGITGNLLVGARRSRDLLKSSSHQWFMEYVLMGVIISMFVLGTVFLVFAHLSSDPTSRRVFNSSSKNRCARGCNIFLLLFVYFLTIVWILVTAILIVPVGLLVMLILVKKFNNVSCIDLQNYGFDPREICDDQLSVFMTKSYDILVCYAIAFVSALLVSVSLIHFLISISANITHLKDNRFATLNAYETTEEHRNSKHSVIDTNM